MFQQTLFRTLTGIALVIGLALYAVYGGYFAREIVIEIAILAILAISLDFVAGFGGMVSLCHGAIFGLSAYAYAAATVIFGLPPVAAFVIAIITSTLFGLAVGGITSKTTGIFFIMATLAFGQMVYVVIFESAALGGDDGMSGVVRFDMSMIGISLNKSMQFALFCILTAIVCYIATATVLRSAFGHTLSGIKSNETRMRALGISVWRYKAMAFGFSAAIAGFAGALAAQHTKFVSPELLDWTLSGEILVVVILGGIGTLLGPAVGAAILIFLKHLISDFTNYWHIIIGIVLIATVFAGGKGMFGQLESILKRPEKKADDHA